MNDKPDKIPVLDGVKGENGAVAWCEPQAPSAEQMPPDLPPWERNEWLLKHRAAALVGGVVTIPGKQ